jgi:hypothetical protein
MDVIGFLYVSLCSSIAQLHDNLGSRHICACAEAGFSSQNGDVLEEIITEKQSSVVRFLWAKGLTSKDVRNSQMMPDQVKKWL